MLETQFLQDNLDPVSDNEEEESIAGEDHPTLQSPSINASHVIPGSENDDVPTLPENNTQVRVSNRARKRSRLLDGYETSQA
jgi:hypothetical protein